VAPPSPALGSGRDGRVCEDWAYRNLLCQSRTHSSLKYAGALLNAPCVRTLTHSLDLSVVFTRTLYHHGVKVLTTGVLAGNLLPVCVAVSTHLEGKRVPAFSICVFASQTDTILSSWLLLSWAGLLHAGDVMALMLPDQFVTPYRVMKHPASGLDDFQCHAWSRVRFLSRPSAKLPGLSRRQLVKAKSKDLHSLASALCGNSSNR